MEFVTHFMIGLYGARYSMYRYIGIKFLKLMKELLCIHSFAKTVHYAPGRGQNAPDDEGHN